MGYDLVAYFDVDQDEIDRLVQETTADSEEEAEDEVARRFKESHVDPVDLGSLKPVYEYNTGAGMHEIWDLTSTGFIRDDARLTNRRYHAMVESRLGKPFPSCLTDINWGVRSRKDALEVADAIDEFFKDEKRFEYFAQWLRVTAKYCSTYELSY
jgi:hypothetical protein